MFFINGLMLERLWKKEDSSKEEESLLYNHLKVGSHAINPRFLNKQAAWNNLFEIIEKFKHKNMLHETMRYTSDKRVLKNLGEAWVENEYDIQELFNFKRNAHFHRFWEMPKCACPKMDNMEYWGTGMSIRDKECPYHGDINAK